MRLTCHADVLAHADASSSLRRQPADKAFQLKGASQVSALPNPPQQPAALWWDLKEVPDAESVVDRQQNTPFRPGGFSAVGSGAAPIDAAEVARSQELLDFSKDLLCQPPGFTDGIDYAHIFDPKVAEGETDAEAEPEAEPELEPEDDGAAQASYPAGDSWTEQPQRSDSGVIKLDSVFADDDDDSNDGWSSEEETAPAPAVPAQPAATKASSEPAAAGAESEEELDTLLEEVANFNNAAAAKAASQDEEVHSRSAIRPRLWQLEASDCCECVSGGWCLLQVWAVEGGEDMSNFRELVPQMAIEYPFELDNFQKEAMSVPAAAVLLMALDPQRDGFVFWSLRMASVLTRCLRAA